MVNPCPAHLLLAVWRIHRRIGMSGGLLAQALGREIGQRITHQQAEELQKRHATAFLRILQICWSTWMRSVSVATDEVFPG